MNNVSHKPSISSPTHTLDISIKILTTKDLYKNFLNGCVKMVRILVNLFSFLFFSFVFLWKCDYIMEKLFFKKDIVHTSQGQLKSLLLITILDYPIRLNLNWKC